MADTVTVPCPMCTQPAAWEGNPYRPFCGEACKNRDLGKWADEQYRMPVESPPPTSDDGTE